MAHRKTKQHTVNVITANFTAPTNISYLDLFEGYDELYAINFITNLDFLAEIMQFFTKIEIIFGNPSIIPTRLDTTFAMQRDALYELYKNEHYEQLAQRINDDSLKFFLADAPLYPEKLFCLKNKEGKTRVILGSSNFDQLPSNCDKNASIICFDDETAYTYYINLFEQFKNEHSYILDKTAAQTTFEDKQILENLPILHKAEADSEHIYQSAPKSTIVKMTEYMADIDRLAKDFVELPKADRKGQSRITFDKIDTIKTKTLDNMAARRAKFEKFMPQLVIEPDKERAFYNDREYNLHPLRADIKQDAELYLKYMEGFDTAVPSKNVQPLKFEYFKLMSWCFLSPFLARIRTTIREATVTDEVFTYPIVALLCGQSNAGKTIYASLLIKMMTDSSLYKAFGQSNFTKTRTDTLLSDIKGLPILIDDITQTQFTNNSGNIIKQEERVIRENKPENLNYYPAMLLTANKDLNSLKNELTKRMVIFHVNASWNNEFTRQQKSPCSELIKKMRNAFYSEYLRRIMPHINEYLSEITDIGSSTTDLYNTSSEVILSIFKDCRLDIPSYMRPLTMKDYFDSKAVNEIMIKFFQRQYRLNRDFFEINKKNNQLIFEDKSSSTVGKMTPMKIVESLPPELEADVVGDKIIMRLDSAINFFGINFKEQSILGKLFNR